MPSPARASVLASRANFLRADRGHVGGSSNASADSRLRHFARWLDSEGYDQQSATLITKEIAIDLIGSYLTSVCQGNSLPRTGKGPLGVVVVEVIVVVLVVGVRGHVCGRIGGLWLPSMFPDR